MILDPSEKVEVSLILGRPFLATSQLPTNIKDGKIVKGVGGEEVVFKRQDAMRHSMDFDDSCYFVDHIVDCVSDFV